jgi:hypothetical protein
MLPTKFRFIWPSGFRGEDFFKSANQKQELSMVAMFVDGSGQNEQSSIDASYQVSLHLAERFQRRRLKCEKLTDDRCQVMAKAYSDWLISKKNLLL